MGRPRNYELRRRLATGACGYLLRVGVTQADLAEMAAGLGTSSRVLVHHFGSKDQLIAAAVTEARERQRSLFHHWFHARDPRTLPALLRTFWTLMQAPEAQPYLRLFSEVYGVTIQQPERFPGFSTRAAVHDRLPVLDDALQSGGVSGERAGALATLVLAVQRGLLLDRLGTWEHERVAAAHEALLLLLDRLDDDPSPRRSG